MSGFVDIRAADGSEFPAWVVRPAGRPRGAIVVVQEIFGVNAHIRAVAEGFAIEGFLAVAPSTFHRVRQGVEYGYTPDDVKAGVALKAQVEALPAPGVMQDLQAAVDFAAQGGKVGMVGYCYGGLLTWRSACALDRLSAAVPYYGGGMTGADEIARRPRVPVLAHFGNQDTSIAMETVEAFRSGQPEVEVQLYDAGHGFNCDHRGAYNAEAAQLARERTLAFFAKHLVGPA